MPAPKRRKVSTATTSSSVGKLTNFARVSKQLATSKAIVEKTVTSSPATKVETADNGDGGKRKRQEEKSEDEKDASTEKVPSATLEATKNRGIRARPISRRTASSQSLPETPKKSASPISAPIEETPSKEACALFSRFGLAKSSPTQFDSSPLREESSIFDSFSEVKSSQISIEQGLPEEDGFPTELQDLINLHASFLNALSLHYAHSGTHTPADLRKLCPDIALIWGKRGVTVEDIRRTLGVLNNQAARSTTLTLSNYGQNKVCIEIECNSGKKGVAARPLDEQQLNAQYTENLTKLWEKYDHSSGIDTFISSLPLQPITNCASLEKISPTLAKGQRRLEDLRANLVLKKENVAAKKLASAPTSSDPKTRESPLKRQSSLLDRIKAKQLLQSTLPPPPSQVDLARTSALHRLEEIISIITLMSTSGSAGQQRVSFTIPTVLGKLRDSMRMPISMEEGRLALNLLAGEVAPEWVRVVGGIGKGKSGAVVVDREKRLEGDLVLERIRVALAGKDS